MRHFYIIFGYAVLLLLSGCEEEAVIKPRDYPFVLTQAPDVNSTSVGFSAEVLSLGNMQIKKYGFVWSEKPHPTLNDFSKTVNSELKTGAYSFRINGGFAGGQMYYVRAYLSTDQYEIYGDEKSFVSLGSLPPSIKNFEPKFGPIGTRVVINGEHFVLSKTGNIVKFGKNEAITDSVSENRLVVVIPKITKPEKVQIAVITAKMTATSQDSFQLWYPWKKISDFPGTYLSWPNHFELNGKIYLIGGLKINSLQSRSDFWEYNPMTDKWSRKPDFPGKERFNAVAFSCNGKGYYGSGTTQSIENKDYLTDFWEYNPDNEKWTKKADFPGTPILNVKSVVNKNKAYISPGYFWESWSTFVNDVWEYDPFLNSWKQKNDFPGSSRRFGLAISTADYGYFGLGLGSNAWQLNEIYRYNAENDSWSVAANYPGKGYMDVAGFWISNKLYMGLGMNSSSDAYSDFWEFDPMKNSWKEMNPCPTKLAPSFGVTINNKGYIGYGWYDLTAKDSTLGRYIYEFDPAQN